MNPLDKYFEEYDRRKLQERQEMRVLDEIREIEAYHHIDYSSLGSAGRELIRYVAQMRVKEDEYKGRRCN